jgi:hypothetical protein
LECLWQEIRRGIVGSKKLDSMKNSLLFQMVLFILSMLIYVSCNQKKCEEIKYFELNEDAPAKIRALFFRLIDSVDNPGGTLVSKAYFYSCDGNSGYFVYRMREGNEEFNQGVPWTLWEEFKGSNSKDEFYESKLFQNYSPKRRGIELDTLPQ